MPTCFTVPHSKEADLFQVKACCSLSTSDGHEGGLCLIFVVEFYSKRWHCPLIVASSCPLLSGFPFAAIVIVPLLVGYHLGSLHNKIYLPSPPCEAFSHVPQPQASIPVALPLFSNLCADEQSASQWLLSLTRLTPDTTSLITLSLHQRLAASLTVTSLPPTIPATYSQKTAIAALGAESVSIMVIVLAAISGEPHNARDVHGSDVEERGLSVLLCRR